MNNRRILNDNCFNVFDCFFHTWMSCVLLAVFLPCVAFAQPEKCVTVDGTALMDGLSLGQAKEQAIENARKNAIYTAIANDISIDALEIAMEIEGNIQGAIPYGEITKETVIKETQISEPRGKTYGVKLEACCKAQKMKNPGFTIAASLKGNKHSYKPGDTLSLSVQSSHDCHIYLFNLLKGEGEDQVIRWFPNTYDTQNFVKANERFSFPRSDDMKIRLELPKGENRVTDYIYILALKAPLDLKKSSVIEGLKENYGGKPSSMKDFITDLVTIPFSQRSEALLKYRIIK